MDTQFFIGVDGGASKCLVRIEDLSGEVLGEMVSGPASIKQSVPQSWQAIYQGIDAILTPLGLNLASPSHLFHLGVGIAGTELKSQCEAFLGAPHPFKSLVLASDAHIACLGAHDGEDGAIIAIGTGVIGWQIANKQTMRVSGWGFPHDDQGGGAWLGFEAVRETLQYIDGRKPQSILVQRVMQFFSEQAADFIAWANQASSSDYAKLAPLVIQAAEQKEAVALALLANAAAAISQVATALRNKTSAPLPLSLVGGLAEIITPYLPATLAASLQPAKGNAAHGAVCLVRSTKLGEVVA